MLTVARVRWRRGHRYRKDMIMNSVWFDPDAHSRHCHPCFFGTLPLRMPGRGGALRCSPLRLSLAGTMRQVMKDCCGSCPVPLAGASKPQPDAGEESVPAEQLVSARGTHEVHVGHCAYLACAACVMAAWFRATLGKRWPKPPRKS